MKLKSRQAQNAVEYLLLFAVVVIVVFLALSPGKYISNSINEAIDLSVNGIESMVQNVEFNEL